VKRWPEETGQVAETVRRRVDSLGSRREVLLGPPFSRRNGVTHRDELCARDVVRDLYTRLAE
jgi:hypothetical protein